MAVLNIGTEIFPDVVPDNDVAIEIAQMVNRYRGRVSSGDPLLRDPGVRVEINAASGDARVTPCGHRFICWARARVFDLETWIENYEAVAIGRVIGGSAVVDHVLTCGASY